MTIVEFLLARIAEDEANFRKWALYGEIGQVFRDRLLAECEAKRRIIERCQHIIDHHVSDDFAADRLAEEVLADLAAIYADHPDYDPAWSPSI